MRQTALLIAGFILIPVTIAEGQQSDIQIEKLAEQSYRLVLKSFSSTSVEMGQQELLPTAKRVCSNQSVGYGKYDFVHSEPLRPGNAEKQPFLLKQEIYCGDAARAPANPVAATKSDPEWRPTAALEKAIELATYGYFASKDSGNYKQAYALQSPILSAITPFVEWQSRAEKFNSEAGSVRSRNVKKITWYKDPPQAQPGLYAAVDFASQFANLDIHCGFVVWHQATRDGSFGLVREEQNFISKTAQQNYSPSDLAALRAKFGC